MGDERPMAGRVCVVTGASSGIGRETALGLAGLGATVMLVSRAPARGEEALEAIRAETGNDQVQLALADLSVLQSVRDLAGELLERLPAIHVLINNAGQLYTRREETADGIERTFALNHLSMFLLTDLLLDRLRSSAPARIVNVSSVAHEGASIRFDDLECRRRYRPFAAYAQSKLANVLFTYELARRLQGTGVTANCLHPGFVRSNFAKNNGLVARAVMLAASPFAISPARGARTSIHLASSPEVESANGGYFVGARAAQSNLESYDADVAARLWAVSEEMTSAHARSTV